MLRQFHWASSYCLEPVIDPAMPYQEIVCGDPKIIQARLFNGGFDHVAAHQ